MWVTLNFLGMQQGSHINDAEQQDSNNKSMLEIQYLDQFHTWFYLQKLFVSLYFKNNK